MVITRRLMESVKIGDDIRVTVVRLGGGQVRLGIDCPRHIRIGRAEIVEGEATGDAGSHEDIRAE